MAAEAAERFRIAKIAEIAKNCRKLKNQNLETKRNIGKAGGLLFRSRAIMAILAIFGNFGDLAISAIPAIHTILGDSGNPISRFPQLWIWPFPFKHAGWIQHLNKSNR